MNAALRYRREQPKQPIALEVAAGGATHVHLPDPASKARLVSAVASATCEADEELELLGEPVRSLDGPARRRLLRRVAVVSPSVALLSNLNAWENIYLPAAYHGEPPQPRVAHIAREVLLAFGLDPGALLGRLPEQLGTFHRLLVSFIRGLVTAPQFALVDGMDAGLSREEHALLGHFENEYLSRQPSGTLVFVDSREEQG